MVLYTAVYTLHSIRSARQKQTSFAPNYHRAINTGAGAMDAPMRPCGRLSAPVHVYIIHQWIPAECYFQNHSLAKAYTARAKYAAKALASDYSTFWLVT
jgi:hypothetical protein